MAERISDVIHRHRRAAWLLLVVPPLAWLALIYLGSLFSLLVHSFYSVDDFTGQIVRTPTLSTWEQVFTLVQLDIVVRTVSMAAAVTVLDVVLAFPLAYVLARARSPSLRALLHLGVLLPLWSNYLVRVYAWKLLLAKQGALAWLLEELGLTWVLDALLALPVVGGMSLSSSYLGTAIVFAYMWLPYMVIPIHAALERVPRSLQEAAADLGATPARAFLDVVLPLALPGVAAGAIFSFSLTLGDFTIPGIIGTSTTFLGQAVLMQQGTAGNVPLAAALSIVPIVVMGVMLWLARMLGAFRAH